MWTPLEAPPQTAPVGLLSALAISPRNTAFFYRDFTDALAPHPTRRAVPLHTVDFQLSYPENNRYERFYWVTYVAAMRPKGHKNS